MSNDNKNLFTKVDQFTDGLSSRFDESSLSQRYESFSSRFDQKQKNKITLTLSYFFSITPFIVLFILIFINSHIKNKNNLFLNLEKKIGKIEKLEKEIKKVSSSFTKHKDFSSKTKAKSFFNNTMREFNLPSTSITINKIEESFVGDLKKIYLEVGFNKLGQQEISKLIKIIKNKIKGSIKKISIRTEKSTRLALGFIHLEFITK
jgi:hypothetical protein